MVADNTSIAHENSGISSSVRSEEPAKLTVVVRRLRDLSEAEREQWRELETQALEPNVYLGVDFVESLATLILPKVEILLLAVERYSQGTRGYIAVLPVVRSRLARWLPLPGLCNVDSKYSFLGGLLLDREQAVTAADMLFAALRDRRWQWFALRMRNVPFDTAQGEILREAAARAGFYWRPDNLLRRPCLKSIDEPQRDRLGEVCGKRLREWRRQRRRLSERGQLEWRLLQSESIDRAVVQRFLELEHGGWKGGNGSSLQSDAARVGFFTRLVELLARQNRVFFTELLLDGAVIASTVNFRVGGSGFAFKIGWDSAYAKFGPGILNELEFIERMPGSGGWGLRQMDSGAMPGSFIERLWADHMTVANGVFTANPLVTWCLRAIEKRQQSHSDTPAERASEQDAADALDGLSAGKSI